MTRPSVEAYRNIRLSIDQYSNGQISGRFCYPLLDHKGFPFTSLVEFLIKTEEMLDEAGFSQSNAAKRRFSPVEHTVAIGEGESSVGAIATFDIRLFFRQHASWQGTITWVEQNSQLSFRSVLEMILILDGALRGE